MTDYRGPTAAKIKFWRLLGLPRCYPRPDHPDIDRLLDARRIIGALSTFVPGMTVTEDSFDRGN